MYKLGAPPAASPLPPPQHRLTSLFNFQYQVVSLQGGVGLHVDGLDGPAQRGVDHRLHLHG